MVEHRPIRIDKIAGSTSSAQKRHRLQRPHRRPQQRLHRRQLCLRWLRKNLGKSPACCTTATSATRGSRIGTQSTFTFEPTPGKSHSVAPSAENASGKRRISRSITRPTLPRTQPALPRPLAPYSCRAAWPWHQNQYST